MMWIISGLYASTKGIRFTLVIVPVFGIAFGVTIGRLVDYFSRMLHKEFHLSKAICFVVLILLAGTLYVEPVKKAYYEAGTETPIMNDAWYNSLAMIKGNSSKDAIITSWWDFGHMFKALADSSINIQMISTSEIKVSCVIDAKDGDKAVKAIHKVFELDKVSKETQKV